MPMWIWLQRLSLIVAAVLLSTRLLNAELPAPEEPPKPSSLAGQLLIASPAMADPRFYHAVILMVRHDQTGALGIIINRPVENRSLASLLENLGDKDTGVTGSLRIFAGGPVQTEVGFVVHSADYHRPETVDIDGRVAMTSTREILHDIANKRGPSKSLFAFGYAGWGPGQLETELGLRAWFTASEDEKLVFDEDRDKVWDDAMQRRTQDL